MKRNRKTPRQRFYRARKNAEWRGIPFLLTFDQWWKLWQDSGKWEQTGTHRGQYCLSRYRDRGAYKLGNVRICLVEENHAEVSRSYPMSDIMKEAAKHWTPEQRARQIASVVKAHKGIPRSAETRAKISAGHMGVSHSPTVRARLSVAFKGRHWVIQDGHRTWL